MGICKDTQETKVAKTKGEQAAGASEPAVDTVGIVSNDDSQVELSGASSNVSTSQFV
jgi:hypothetical protein